MVSAPEANSLNERQQRATIIGQRILDGRRNRALRLSLYDSVANQFAELLGEHLLRDAGHGTPQRREVFRRLRQPVHDDQFPFTADRRQRSRQRTPA